MWPDIFLAIVIFLFLSLVSWLVVTSLITMLVKAQQVDKPNERTMHSGAVPRGGGIVISGAMITSLVCAAILGSQSLFYGVFALLMVAWTVLSWWDDRFGLSALRRFVPQLVFAVATVQAFGYVNHVIGIDIGLAGAVVTLLGIVWMANLYNFMDGIDGLAASQAIVASLTFAIWFYALANPTVALICVVVAGSSYGFLLCNWQPARIFMGDVGSITLGAFFATLMIIAATRHDVPILSLMLVFGFFILDTGITILRRIYAREVIWQAHTQHLYQRLVKSGFSHQSVTLASIILMLASSALATLSLARHDMIILFIALQIVGYACIYWLCHYREKLIIK